MNRNDRVNAILDRQQAGIEAILAASRQLLDKRNSFSIESLDALVAMRSTHIAELAALDEERRAIASDAGDQAVPRASAGLTEVLKDLSQVDERLQDMIRLRQVGIINSMATMRNSANFTNLAESPQVARQLLDVTR